MKKTSLLCLVALVLCTSELSVKAQGISSDSIKAQMIRDWQRAKTYTNDYLNTMPANKYGSRAVDSIRSFSEQMLHLSMGTIGLVANGTGAQRIYPGYNMEKSPTAQNKDSVWFYVNASYDYAINSIKNMDAATLGEIVKRGPYSETKYAWLQKAFEHQTHHRGQCTIYIRLQGIRPPNEQLL